MELNAHVRKMFSFHIINFEEKKVCYFIRIKIFQIKVVYEKKKRGEKKHIISFIFRKKN